MRRKLSSNPRLVQYAAAAILMLFSSRIAPCAMAQGQPAFAVCSASDAHGTIYLPVRVNENLDARLFVDTGSVTFLSDAFVRKHAIATHAVVGSDGSPERFPDGRPVTAARITITVPRTPIRFEEDVPVLRAEVIRSMGVACDGILGCNTLSGMAVLVNMVNRSIVFLPGGNLKPEMLRTLGMDGIKPVGLIPSFGGSYQISVGLGDKQKGLMLMDTGSEFTKVWPEMAHKISTDWKRGGRIAVSSGQFDVFTTRMERVSVGAAQAVGQRIFYSDAPAAPQSSPLGRDFLCRFAVLIDFPANRLYLRDLELGEGPTSYVRRLRGDDVAAPPLTNDFPYVGRTISKGARRGYRVGESAAFPDGTDAEPVRVERNPPPDDARHKPAEIPIEIENGAIIVPATVDGKPMRMLLDTASISTWLTPTAAKRLDLKVRTIDEGGLKRESAAVGPVALSTLAPEFRLNIGECGVADRPSLYRAVLGDLPKVDGVLGLDCLSGQVFGLDLEKRKLVLWPLAATEDERLRWVAAGPGASGGTTTIPLDHESGDWYYVEAAFGAHRAKLAVATAYAGGCRLPESLAAILTPSARFDSVGAAMTAEHGGPHVGETGGSRTAAFGEFTLQSVATEIVPEKGADVVPLLGLGILRRRRVLLDLPGKKLSVSLGSVLLSK